MNIKDSVKETLVGDKLVSIFERQKELMEKYHHIESKSGLCQTEDCPVNLDDKRGQARLKDFSWRVTEEVAEAMEALPQMEEAFSRLNGLMSQASQASAIEFKEKVIEVQEEMDDIQLHFREELVDALHFLTEKTILEGITPIDIHNTLCGPIEQGEDMLDNLFLFAMTKGINPLNDEYANFITALGLTNNCLKNKPWKQTQMITDKVKYKELAINAWLAFIKLLLSAGLDSTSTADYYLKKSQVNAFRQRSNY